MSSPSSSPRHASHRPEAVKRTYGSRVKLARPRIPSSSGSSEVFARGLSPPALVSCSSDSVEGMLSSGFRIKTPELEEEKEENVGEKRKGRTVVLVTNTRDNQASEDEPVSDRPIPKKTKSSTTAPTIQGNLKSFFTFHSQPKIKQPKIISSALRAKSSTTASTAPSSKPAKLAQLHLVPVRHSSSLSSSSTTTTARPPLLTTCSKCNMSYIRGGIGGDDDAFHRAHCIRVTEGVKWNSLAPSHASGASSVTMTGAKLASWRRKGAKTGGGLVVRPRVEFGNGLGKEKAVGNVVCIEGYEASSDKRVMEIIESVDTVLSAPTLPPTTLARCKIFLFTTSCQPPVTVTKRAKSSATTTKPVERVVACVVTQPIRTGMRVLREDEVGDATDVKRNEWVMIGDDAEESKAGVSSKAVICSPTRLPCKLGVHRIFTVPKYRGFGISKILLDVACEKTIYGYTCDPKAGDIAFSQPTNSGKALMDAWGKGAVRVFVEDEQQTEDEE